MLSRNIFFSCQKERAARVGFRASARALRVGFWRGYPHWRPRKTLIIKTDNQHAAAARGIGGQGKGEKGGKRRTGKTAQRVRLCVGVRFCLCAPPLLCPAHLRGGNPSASHRDSLCDGTAPGGRGHPLFFFFCIVRGPSSAWAQKKESGGRGRIPKGAGRQSGFPRQCVGLVCGILARIPTLAATENTGVPLFRIGERTHYAK